MATLSSVLYRGMRVSHSLAGDLETAASYHDGVQVIRLGRDTTPAPNLFWSDRRSLAASASHTIDLRGALTNVLGETVAFAKVIAIKVVADTANAHNLHIGNAAANQFLGFLVGTAHLIKLKPGAAFQWDYFAGEDVTNGSNDDLQFLNSGAGSTIFYNIEVIGVAV